MTNAVLQGKLYAGNMHVRFDQGKDAPAATPNGFACACAKIATAGFAVLLCGAAMGADYHWTGAAGDHLWSTAGNWTDSSGNAVAAPTPDTAYTYNFTQSAFADKAFSLVVTQDINVVFGTAVAVHGAGSSAETTDVTFVSAKGCKLSMPDGMTFYLRSNSRLTLETDMSADKSSEDINKSGEGELVFNLKAANTTLRNVRIKGGLYRIAATGAQPLIRVAFDTSATESNGGVFENDKSGMTLGGFFIGGLSDSRQSIGRTDLNGTMLNVGDASNTTSTNFLPMPVFADGGKLTLQNERRMYLEGLPLGGTLAVDRADAQVVTRRTAVRWLFDDASNPLKDTVGAGERVLAPAGMPEVVEDSVRGKVLSISDGKYLMGPDANAGFAELQPQPTNNPYTVAFWFKPDATRCDDKGKIFYWGENANGKTAALRLNNDKAEGLMFTVWGNNRKLATADSPRDGEWHHFAVTYNGLTTFRIYYDGEQVDTFTSDIYYPPNRNFYVGRTYGGWVSDGANPYTGLLDDFLIGSYELPAESIKKLVDDELAATISAGSVEAKSAGEVAFAKKNANLARLSGNALAGGVTLQAEGTTLTVGADGTAGDDLFKGKIGGAATALVKEGADYALELSGPAAAVTNVTVKEGTLTLRRPLARKGLVVWYPFDENRDLGLDAGPARLPLFKEGAGMLSTVADGASGSALKFPGGTYIHSRTEFAPPSFPHGAASYTISVWIRPTEAACSGTVPICCWGANSTRQLSMLRFDSTSSIVFTNWGSGDDAVATGLSLCDGNWHHVVATYDGSTKKLYFDGVEKASTGGVTLDVGAGSSIQLGHCSVGSRADQYYAGDMDEFMVLDYTWSAAETAAEYARRPAAAVAAESLMPAPVAHWTFDDEANPGADSSANGLTLTKSGEVALEAGEAICGKAARFSSASGFFKLDEFPSAIPSSSNAVTFIVRYRPDKTQNGTYYPGIVMWGDTAGWNMGKLVKISTEKETPASIRLTIGGQNYAPGGFYRTDMGTERSRWITMAFVCSPKIDKADKSCVKLYVDGEYVEQRESGVDVTAKEFSIGSNYGGTQNFYGLIDDVQIYDSALSSGQIRLISEGLESMKGSVGEAHAHTAVLSSAPDVAVAADATLRVASNEAIAALSGAGTVEVSPLASLTVRDMRGFSGSLTGHGTVTVEKGWTLDRSRVSVAPTLKVHAPGSGLRIIIR